MRLVLGEEIPEVYLMNRLCNLNIIAILLLTLCLLEARQRVLRLTHPPSTRTTFVTLKHPLVPLPLARVIMVINIPTRDKLDKCTLHRPVEHI